jgi:hypothetical protein
MEHTILLYKILLPSILSFILAITVTPFFSHIFYKYKLWKRSSRIDSQNISNSGVTMSEEFKKIHNEKELHTPRVGGIIVWFSISLTVLISLLLAKIFNQPWSDNLNFMTRNQTLIPFLSLLLGASLGLIDDFLQIFGNSNNLKIGIPRKIRIAFVLFVGAIEGIWFYQKLGFDGLSVPFVDIFIPLGASFILFYMLLTRTVKHLYRNCTSNSYSLSAECSTC